MIWNVPSPFVHDVVARVPTVVAVKVAVTADIDRSRSSAPTARLVATRAKPAATTNVSLRIPFLPSVNTEVIAAARGTLTFAG